MTVLTGEVLRGKDLGKRYGAIQALTGVDISLQRGAVTSLCGDNGAGKSTLIKILSGATTPTTGSGSVRRIMPSRPVSRLCSRTLASHRT
jgi:ABC-type sugar transport system ATPase subunit